MYSLCLILVLVIIIIIPAFIYTYVFIFQRSPHPLLSSSSADRPPPPRAAKSELVTVVVVTRSVEAEETKETDSGGECSVCLSAFEDGEELWQLNLCKHLFHAPCIDKWLHAHSNCPVCRAYVKAQPSPNSGLVVPARARGATLHHRVDFWQGLPDSAGLV